MQNVKSVFNRHLCACILGLAHVYHTQLSTAQLRKNYRIEIAKVFAGCNFAREAHIYDAPRKFTDEVVLRIITEEQRYFHIVQL